MRTEDVAAYAITAMRSQPHRTFVTATGAAVGVAAVVWLTAIGFGVRSSVVAEFSQFGTDVIAVTPGKSQTFGVSGSMLNTVRPLTAADARAIERLPGVVAVAPVVAGNAEVEHGGRSRRTEAHGVGSAMPRVWNFALREGTFALDDGDDARATAVLGGTVARELFPVGSAVGQAVRIGGERYRVVGVLADKGQFLGLDLDDAVYVPLARGLSMFDREGLMQIAVEFAPGADPDAMAERVRELLAKRHGRDDATVRAQRQMLEALDDVLTAIAIGAGAIGALSLVVGAFGIAAIQAVAVRERTSEVGLLRAIGASRRAVAAVFLAEATALGALGGALGLVGGLGLAYVARVAFPALPVEASFAHAVAAIAFSALAGALAGAAPAIRAARLDPVEALRAE